jgi:hypothetical protein
MDTFRNLYNTHNPHKETAEFKLSLLNHRKGEPHRLVQVHLITSVTWLENISNTKKDDLVYGYFTILYVR